MFFGGEICLFVWFFCFGFFWVGGWFVCTCFCSWFFVGDLFFFFLGGLPNALLSDSVNGTHVYKWFNFVFTHGYSKIVLIMEMLAILFLKELMIGGSFHKAILALLSS